MRRKGATILHRRPLSSSLTAAVALALFAAGLLAGGPASAEVPAASASDPVVGEVVRLLEAGLGEPLVQRWLDDSGKIPALPTADDLIALKKAGASDKLIAALLDRASAHAPAAPAAPEAVTKPASAPPPAPVSAPAAVNPMAAPMAVPPPPAAPEIPAAPAPIAAPAAAPEAADAAAVLVDASILYIHVPEEGEPWDLVVYLDGRPFAPVAAARSTSSAQTWTSQRPLAPGPHILRWAQERHRDRKGEIGLHAARFDPEPLYFAIAPGTRGAIEFEFRDSSGFIVSRSGPVKVRVTADGRELASRSSSGDPALWPLLCEEIEANADGKKPGFNDRQALRHCARWADLWKELPDAPGRDAVRPAVR